MKKNVLSIDTRRIDSTIIPFLFILYILKLVFSCRIPLLLGQCLYPKTFYGCNRMATYPYSNIYGRKKFYSIVPDVKKINPPRTMYYKTFLRS